MDVNKEFAYSAIFGYQLIPCEECSDLVQKRRHKKKRINKKWLKRYGLKAVPKKEIYITGDRKIIAHPTVINRIMLEIGVGK